VYRIAIRKPNMVVIRAESFPREEKSEMRKDTAKPIQPDKNVEKIHENPSGVSK
jgi:hypothetical protein